MARLTATSATARPMQTADAAPDAGWGITPVWNPMIILAFFYAVLFLIFAAVVGFIFVRRRRRALALARAEEAAAVTSPTTSTTSTSQDPEKGQTQASVSGDSDGDGDGFGEADKTVTIAQAGGGGGEYKGSPALDGTRAGTGTNSKRGCTGDAPSSEYWTPPLPRTMRFSSRASTRLSMPYQGNMSDLSLTQRDTSQVIVWLPSFQSNVGAGTGPGSGASVTRAGEGGRCSEMESREQARTQEQAQTQEQEQEKLASGEQVQVQAQEREQVPAQEDPESSYGVAQ